MSDPTKIRGFRNVSTTRQAVFVTENGEVKIRQLGPRRWEVFPRGGAAYVVGGKQEAVDEARKIAARGLTLTRTHELQEWTRPSKQPKKSHAQIKREVDAILLGKPLGSGNAGPRALGVTPGDEDVARAVHRVIREVDSTGRFGPEKVFISEIWTRLSREPGFGGMTESDFKRALLRLNRSRLVNLARADLVGAMNRQQVRASEIEDRGSTFHFVLDPHASFPY